MIGLEINDLVVKLGKSYDIPKTDEQVLNLTVNQNFIKHPFVNGLNINRYPVYNNNYYNLLNEVSDYVRCEQKNILLTNGSGAGLKLVLDTFCNINTSILVPFPNYPGFIHDAYLASCNVNMYKTNSINTEFINEIKDSKIIYLSTPNIPIGYVLNHTFIDIIKSNHDKLFIIDEAYFEYSGKSNYWSTFVNELKNVIISRTFSKAFGAAGIRLGYLVAHEELIYYLRIPYCSKSVTEFSINKGLKLMRNKKYYLDTVISDIKLWKKTYEHIKTCCNKDLPITGVEYSGNAPFLILYCEDANYVCKMFLHYNVLIRNKSDDIGSECVRISLSNSVDMNRVIMIIKKINYMSTYSNIYLDIDKTIRDTRKSEFNQKLVHIINKLYKAHNICFITNNIDNYQEIEDTLNNSGIKYHEIITPLKYHNIILTDREIDHGYCVRNDKLYIFKFPKIDYALFNLIYKFKVIHIVEDDHYEDSLEQGFTESINIPFIGSFLKLLSSDIKTVCIGKRNLIVNPKIDSLMVGDSNDDYLFAYSNNMVFKKVNNSNDTLLFLQKLLI